MDSDERRAKVEKARRRALAEGGWIDQGPELAGWIEEWITGEIDIEDLIARYADRQKSQSGEG